MSHFTPTRVADRHAFDTLIDARSPAEFALDHLPGAINCPVLDDDERRIVGTLYKQTGAFEARRVGGAMVAANLARHLREHFADQPADWKPLVYCWRGGLRSGSMVTWMRMVGWDAQQLAGGYKSFRRHVITQLDTLCPQLQLRVLCGTTGSAKTRILQALAAQGAQVLDLEALASHKGSLLGALPGVAQPSQTRFETLIATALEPMDIGRPVYIEGESARIGRLTLPRTLLDNMRAAPCIEIRATPEARLAYLLRDYAYLGADGPALASKLDFLTPTLGKEVVQRWQHWARTGELQPLFAALMAQHYDPHYERSQARQFNAWAQRQRVEAASLSEPGIAATAHAVLARENPALPRPVLLLVPGLMCDAAVWQAQCAGLADLAECVVVDHGEADSLDGMARQALACVPAGRSFALAGHSMGGRVALEMLRLAPERVKRLALMDTGYQARPAGAVGEAEAAQRFALLALAQRDGMRTMGQQWSQAMVHPDRLGGPVHEAILQMIARATPQRFAAQINALLARPDATGVLRGIHVPTLLLCGRDDSWSPLARHIDMQALVPHATLSVVEHSGHMSTMEQPEAVTQAMRQWLLSTVPDSQNTSQISL